MATVSLKDRVAALEAEIARLKTIVEGTPLSPRSGWRQIVGAFAGDPGFWEAMRLGREWRESFQPKARKKQRKP